MAVPRLEGGDGRPDNLLARLAEWRSADLASRSAAERSRTRALVEQSAATATFGGLLLDLAEAGTEVTVWVGAGLKVAGRLAGIARDFVAVAGRDRTSVLVRTGAITAVVPSLTGGTAGGHLPTRPGGQRRPAVELTLADALDTLAAQEAPVTVRCGDEPFTGHLMACGRDLLTIRTGGSGRRPVYLPLDAVSYVELR